MSLEEEKKKQTKKVNDFRLWKQSHNLKNENIIVKANGNQSTEEIKKFNALYLINTTQKINKKDTSSLPPIEEKKQPANFKYINDNYRKQLNKAFLNFNPIIHLGNLNILRKADPEINSDIEKLTKHIDEDLIEITNKNYYHNQYEKIVQKNKKRKLKFENMISIQTTMSTAETHQNTQTHKPIFRKKLKNRKRKEISREGA